MKYWTITVLLCALVFGCTPDFVSITDIAGDWTITDWPLSETPGDVGTVTLRVNVDQRAAFFANVPENDWGYEEGDVAFYNFQEGDRAVLFAMTRLRYLDLQGNGGEESVAFQCGIGDQTAQVIVGLDNSVPRSVITLTR